jgi:hypothetical protein
MNRKQGETLYPGEKITTKTIGLTDTQERHVQTRCAVLNLRKPGSGWNRSKYVQSLIDADMKKCQREEEKK